jgi:pseudaminic acid synthase
MKIKVNKNLSFAYNEPPKIIAEISGNHNGSKHKFLNLIKKAIQSEADLIKIQTYEPQDITINSKKKIFKITNGIWKNKYLWDLYTEAHTPFSWHQQAFALAKKYNKVLFSSPFSIRAVDFLEKLNVSLYKIASFEITDFRLIDYIASKKKPIIISTGVSKIKDIINAIKIINKYHNKVIILHCVSGYPTKLKDTNLKRINLLKKAFKNNLIGLSDHTNDIYSSVAAVPLGIVAIEKHFNFNKNHKTIDSEFSIDPAQLKKLKKNSSDIFFSLNKKTKMTAEKISGRFKRSLYSIKNIKTGDKLTTENIGTFRPKSGIPAEHFFKILGRKVKKNIKIFSSIYYNDLK